MAFLKRDIFIIVLHQQKYHAFVNVTIIKELSLDIKTIILCTKYHNVKDGREAYYTGDGKKG
jgi:hypothetical protein